MLCCNCSDESFVYQSSAVCIPVSDCVETRGLIFLSPLLKRKHAHKHESASSKEKNKEQPELTEIHGVLWVGGWGCFMMERFSFISGFRVNTRPLTSSLWHSQHPFVRLFVSLSGFMFACLLNSLPRAFPNTSNSRYTPEFISFIGFPWPLSMFKDMRSMSVSNGSSYYDESTPLLCGTNRRERDIERRGERERWRDVA